MAYEYLIRRLLPFSVGFLTAVFVTSLFETVGAITQTGHVPAVETVYSGSSKSCKAKFRTESTGFSDVSIQHKPAPGYTEEARQNGTEGSVVLFVTFGADGEIGSVEPRNYLRDGLTERAIEAAHKISFRPATRHGVPVSTAKEVEYIFSVY